MCLKTYLSMSQILDLFMQTYISNITIWRVMFMTGDALKTWFIISFFLDAFLILRKFLSLMGICFEEKVYYMIVKVESIHLIDENSLLS